MSVSVFVCLALCGIAHGISYTWNSTSPVVSSGYGDSSFETVPRYNDIVLLCNNGRLVVTNEIFSEFEHTTESCGQILAGPVGFLQVANTAPSFNVSTNGKTWSEVSTPDFKLTFYATQRFYSSEDVYAVCRFQQTNMTKEHHIECASSTNLKDWKLSNVENVGAEYPEITFNRSMVFVQGRRYSGSKCHYDGWFLDLLTQDFTSVYSFNGSCSTNFVAPSVVSPNVEKGWLVVHTYRGDIVWTDDFVHYTKKPAITSKQSRDMAGYNSEMCMTDDGYYVFSTHFQPAHYLMSKTPLVSSSWKKLLIPVGEGGREDIFLTCLGTGVFLFTRYGRLFQSRTTNLNDWKPIYNGATAELNAITSVNGNLFVTSPTSPGWTSTNRGQMWKELKVNQTSNQIITYTTPTGSQEVVGTNGTVVFSTSDFVHYVINELPIPQIFGLTIFKGQLYGMSSSGVSGKMFFTIMSTHLPLTENSQWTNRWTFYDTVQGTGLQYLVGDDEAGFMVAGGEGYLLYSQDGNSFQDTGFFDHTERRISSVMGVAAGNGAMYMIAQKFSETHTMYYGAWQIFSNGLVHELDHFSQIQPDTASGNALKFVPETHQFYFQFIGGAVGVTSNFTDLHTMTVPGGYWFTHSLDLTVNNGNLVALYWSRFSSDIMIGTPEKTYY